MVLNSRRRKFYPPERWLQALVRTSNNNLPSDRLGSRFLISPSCLGQIIAGKVCLVTILQTHGNSHPIPNPGCWVCIEPSRSQNPAPFHFVIFQRRIKPVQRIIFTKKLLQLDRQGFSAALVKIALNNCSYSLRNIVCLVRTWFCMSFGSIHPRETRGKI